MAQNLFLATHSGTDLESFDIFCVMPSIASLDSDTFCFKGFLMSIHLFSSFLSGNMFRSGNHSSRKMFRVQGDTLECLLTEGLGNLNRRRFPLNFHRYCAYGTQDLIVDKVIKYERLAEEMQGVMDRLGIPFDGDLGFRRKSNMRKDRRPYTEVYTEAQRKIIEEAFAVKIQLLDYRYGDDASA
jgi:hypothetical protein